MTDQQQREAPYPWAAAVASILFNGPIMFGRGVRQCGPDDHLEAWREVNGDTSREESKADE